MTYFLDLRADSVGGILAADVTPRNGWNAIAPDALDRQAQGRDILFVAHGFRVDRQGGIDRLSQWENRLQLGVSALFVGILWPGDSSWVLGLDYPVEGNEAIGSGKMLSQYINRDFADAASLSFASHSLGARVVLETARGLSRRVRSLILMAGAIDDDCLTDEYRDAAGNAEHIAKLASKGDEVLKLAFPAGNFVSGLITRQSPYWHAALGREGPAAPRADTVWPRWQIPDGWNYDHGDYFGGAPAVGPLIAPPQDVPPQDTSPPVAPVDWKPAWSAAIAASRYAG